ncbi:hypothetical protein SNEBB_004826 [Seison nebaliae]|nr:hypothetical protein SNEBB_004826 [Seison nebaliae]
MDSLNSENSHSGTGGEILGYIESYGWFIIGGVALMYYVWHRYKDQIDNRINSIKAATSAGIRKKDDDTKQDKTEERIRAARQKLQEKHDEQSLMRKLKKQEAERQKKLLEIEKHEQLKKGLSVKKDGDLTLEDLGLGTKTERPTKSKNDDYNPLMGDGAACSRMKFRPAAGG